MRGFSHIPPSSRATKMIKKTEIKKSRFTLLQRNINLILIARNVCNSINDKPAYLSKIGMLLIINFLAYVDGL